MLPCLILSIIKYWSRVKWSDPGNRVAPSPTPWCSSYWKGSLRVALTTVANNYIYMCVCVCVCVWVCGGARGLVVTVIGNEHGDLSSNLSRSFFNFTYCSYNRGRYEYVYPLSSYGQIVVQSGLLNLGMATSLREGKHWIQTYLTPLVTSCSCCSNICRERNRQTNRKTVAEWKRLRYWEKEREREDKV